MLTRARPTRSVSLYLTALFAGVLVLGGCGSDSTVQVELLDAATPADVRLGHPYSRRAREAC